MVEELVAWYERHRVALDERQIAAVLARSPDDGRDKASAWIRFDRGALEAEVIVWDTGECELWGPLRDQPTPGTDPRAEHRQLRTTENLHAAVERALSCFA